MTWAAGQSGNPLGRRLGHRDKIGRNLLRDLHAYWQKQGPQAIEDAHKHNPAKFLQIVASLLPRDATLTLNVTNEFIEALKLINQRGRENGADRILEITADTVAVGDAADD